MAENHPQTEEGTVALEAGDPFPGFDFAILGGDADREYLGLDGDATHMSLAHMDASHAVLIFFNTACSICLKGLASFSELHRELDAAWDGPRRTLFLGVGVMDARREVAKLGHEMAIPFPLCADTSGEVFETLGRESVPLVVVLEREEAGRWRVSDIRSGGEEIGQELFDSIRSLAGHQSRQ